MKTNAMYLSRSSRWLILWAAALSACATFIPTLAPLLLWSKADCFAMPWIFITGHLVHLSTQHWLANLGALTVLCYVNDQTHSPSLPFNIPFWLITASSGISVSLGLQYGPIAVAWYGGLSGVLYGLFAALTLKLCLLFFIQKHPFKLALASLLLSAGMIKTAIDSTNETGALGALGIPVVPVAHFYGYAGGVFTVLLCYWLMRMRRRRSP